MKCPKCQTENPDTRKFCRECGAKLLIICPQCSNENLPGDKFCGECGHNLSKTVVPRAPARASEPAQPLDKPAEPIALSKGERRQTTIVFSDLSGYTSMNERLDPFSLISFGQT